MELFEKVFGVSEFNEFISLHLQTLGEVVVEGEINQLRISSGKWIFATIKDENASVEVFGSVFRINNINSLEEGMLVKIYGVPQLYQKTGRFSISASRIIPSGEGALKIAYEKLKKQLENEGLFDVNRKRPLPMFPQNIGLITAKDSQAYNDFIKITKERMGGLKIYFCPVSVQGRDSVSSIIKAIKHFNGVNNIDMLVLTRGGGSLEDLMSFNDESVVRAVFGSKVPIVCAIGHEGDISLAELAADVRASTPSNAAELTVRDSKTVISQINNWCDRLRDLLILNIRRKSSQTDSLLHKTNYLIRKTIETVYQTISRFQIVFLTISQSIKFKNEQVVKLSQKLTLETQLLIKKEIVSIESLERLVKNLDYRKLLEKGYSLTTNQKGIILKDINDVKIGDIIVSNLCNGKINSEVKIIDNNDQEESE